MRYLFIAVLLLCTAFKLQPIHEQIIYGENSFVEIATLGQENNWYQIAKSVAVIVPEKYVIKVAENTYELKDFKLIDKIPKLTTDYPFRLQPAVGIGTAALVSETQILTAGHLVNDLKKAVILFDYEWDITKNALKKATYHTSEIYRAKKVLTKKNSKKGDYALIMLDKVVKNRDPLKVKSLEDRNIEIAMISAPDGVPLKLTKEGPIWKKDPKLEKLSGRSFFIHNLDNSGGSSGAPIFDVRTGCIIGIQSGGDDNFVQIEGVVYPIQGDEDGKNTNIRRDLTGEYGSIVSNSVIEKINHSKISSNLGM